MEAIASYHRGLTTVSGVSLDDRTWRDLDLDAVYVVLDRTSSSVGQQCLYHRLRSSASATTLQAFEALISRMAGNVALREQCQMALASLRGAAGYDIWRLAEPGVLEVRRWHVVSPVLALAMLISAALALWWPGAIVITIALLPVCLAVRILNARRVAAVIDALRLIGPLIAAAATLQRAVDDDSSDLTGGLVADVPALRRLRMVTGWIARDSVTMDPLSGVLFELLNFFLALDGNALLFGAIELGRRAAALQRTLAAVGEVDAAIAIASYRASTDGWTRPSFHEVGSAVSIRGLRHPLLPRGVPNAVSFAPPYGVLITGSNMSGKSTFLRSLGVAAVMSRTINTCTATSYECPMLAVRSCMGRMDDLIAGRSYYLDEVQGVLSLVHASESSEAHLFLLDELFRGTNAVERVAAGEAVLAQLASANARHLVVAATHDSELVSLLASTYTTFHFSDRVTAEGLVFEYHLTEGPSTHRNAIALLELNGAPPEVVARARVLAQRLERKPES